MGERYVHLVGAGDHVDRPERLSPRAIWISSRDPAAQATARALTPRHVVVAPGLDDAARAGEAVRELLREHPRGDLVLVSDPAALTAVAAELTGRDPRPVDPSSDVVTVRLESSASPAPLGFPVVLVAGVLLSLVDVGQWLVTGRPGYAIGAAAVVAVLVAAPRQTRDLGISLLVVVLLASFLDLGWLNFVPRLQE